MKIDVLTLFPGFFNSPLKESIIKRAIEKKLVNVNVVNIRDFTHDKHRTADDSPFGGGNGMVMKAGPIFEAVDSVKDRNSRIVLLSASGKQFDYNEALRLSMEKHIVFICGHYEGVDNRVRLKLATDEISIGDYVLTGGEAACLVVIDALIRFIPGVLGNSQSAVDESFVDGLLEFPHYTRPSVYKGMGVPSALLSGNHKQIEKFRKESALELTFQNRPDLLKKAKLSKEDKVFLRKLKH